LARLVVAGSKENRVSDNDTAQDTQPYPEIDATRPQSARVYDFLLGGKDNFGPDRAVGQALINEVPTLPAMVRAQRAFLARAVGFLAGEAGINQFLDIGTGIPTANNVHEVAGSIIPDARVLYVDNDPIVLAHARAWMTTNPVGKTAFILADLRDPQSILANPALTDTLDPTQPVALMLVGILHHLRDADDPFGVVSTLVDWLPAGSYVTIAAPASDFDVEAMKTLSSTAERSGIPYVARSREEIERFFTGLDLIEPGVAPILGWRPDPDTSTDVDSVFGWAGVARKS
jgi:S-adenosyl methyltransferase